VAVTHEQTEHLENLEIGELMEIFPYVLIESEFDAVLTQNLQEMRKK
jgi:hypothetical protein